MVDTKDILIKAAEDVTQGMWCKDEWFADFNHTTHGNARQQVAFSDEVTVEELQASKRCAEGSVQLAARMLGGDHGDYEAATYAVERELRRRGDHTTLFLFNDEQLPDDPFEAGQQLAELFRQTAESL